MGRRLLRTMRKKGSVLSMATKSPTTPGEAIRALRSLAGMTLDEVAAQAGVSASHLSRVETGAAQPTPAWLGVVSEVIARRLTRQRGAA